MNKKWLLVVILALGIAAATELPGIAMADPAFDLRTTAKRYNFAFTGEAHGLAPANGARMSVVGWLEPTGGTGLGNVTGHAEFTCAGGIGGAFGPFSAELSSASVITVQDSENGIYSVFLVFVTDDSLTKLTIRLSILLEDPRGVSGKVSGAYSCDAGGFAVGVVSGGIAQRVIR